MNNANYTMRSADVSGRGMALPHESTRLSPLQATWHRRWIVVGSVIVGMIGALVLSSFMPKVYTRTAQIIVEPASTKSMGEGVRSMEAYLNTQAELIAKSAAIHADAINLLAETGGLSGTGPDTLATLRANLTATPGKNDNIITIAYS